jgi:serine protease
VDTLRSCLVGVLAAFSISSTAAVAGTNETNPVRAQPAVAAAATSGTHRILVKLRTTSATTAARAQAQSIVNSQQARVTISALQGLAARSNLMLLKSHQISEGLHAVQVSVAAGESLTTTLAKLRADPAVEYAEADQRRFAHAVPNDPLYTGQWYEQNTQPAAVDAMTAWDTSTGRSDIVIADLDTGVRFDHPDLGAAAGNRLISGYDFISDPAVANDGDGRDADPSDPGDFVTQADANMATFTGCTVENSSWHGTRTAGILGAISNNATGIAGMTWQPKILVVRVLGKCGGLDSDILDAMRWAAGLHVDGVPDNTHPAQIINMSLGAVGSCTAAQQTVIDEVVAKGVLIVASAGNEGGPVDSPANCNGVAAISGLRNIGTKVGFSSLGPQVTVSAPAGNCVNATGACLFSIDTTTNNGTTIPGTNGYTDQLNPNLGTSFSAPIASGIAALMLGVNSNLRSAQLIARLREGAKAFPVSSDATVPNCHVPTSANDLQTAECNCTTQTCGAGMANAPGSVKAALRPIAAIAVPATVTAGQNVTLSGAGSAAACGHTITTYAWTNVSSSTNPIQGGNTASAVVVAPTSGSYTLRLTVTDDAGRQDTADVIVSSTAATTTAPAVAGNLACASGTSGTTTPVTVTVTPATASISTRATQSFTATVANTSNTAVTWQVNGVAGGNSTVGTISSAGVYTAPAAVPTPAIVTIKAVSVADTTRFASAQVTITAAISVSVSPTTSSVVVNATQAFSATVSNSSNTNVTWQVNGVTGGNTSFGTISSSGLYTAPATVPSNAVVTITAVSAADATRSAAAQVTVTPMTAPSTGGTSTTGGSIPAGNGNMTNGGGGALDALTLLACTLALVCVAGRRVRVEEKPGRP